ncbi:hypothetical protein CVT26_000661 [Gymnopilus dilepis]|uniref:CxC2-like cysteine cluster KDZ transposase-associated domain-containing protein n=1 Tax=Gymnopilus dilepis TaxID=231916 RepID=A0A409WEK3_9AGAR|nr:hypothetical protein CVT26_000661 [Gymnopilus dilepis]
MSNGRPKKRQRLPNTSYHDSVPLDDAFDHIHAREGRLRRVGDSVRTAPLPRTTLIADVTWNGLSSWTPPDDANYALDSTPDVYNEMLEANVMDQEPPTVDKPAKKKRSQVSKRPHVTWMEQHRETYLDEMLRWEGRADASSQKECPDCILRSTNPRGAAEYRCEDCFIPDLTCASCCVKRHKLNPFHRIEKWTGSTFTKTSLKTLGLKVQLNHMGMFCSNPIPCHSSMLVLHTNGIHEVAIQYCGCNRAIAIHLQLLRRRLYPSSQINPKNCVSFDLLRLLHHLALATKASTYDFYRGLEKSTDGVGVNTPKSRYRALLRSALQWRHLKLLKRGGRGNDPSGVQGTQNGELAIRCPSCPWPGVNLVDDWDKAPQSMKFLYMVFVCMDANFRLKNQLVSNYSQDPGLGIGWAYMVPRKPYEKYVLSKATDDDISTCVGFQALAKANTRYSVGLRYTGTNATVCGRSEMIFPLGVGNLHKGERYSNMDYIFGSVLRLLLVALVLISYDVACQWFVHLLTRMKNDWPDEIKPDRAIKLIPAIPKLHYSMHEGAGHEVYSLNLIPGAGLSDCECPERVWAPHNPLGNSTKTQGPGSRHDVLDDHFNFWNWSKYIGMGTTLLRKYKAAVAERNVQSEGHRGLTAILDSGQVKIWEKMCEDWENDEAYPKKKKNPYYVEGMYLSEVQVKKALATEEEERLKSGGVSLHNTSAATFIGLGLEIEEFQRRLHRMAKDVTSRLATTKEGNLTEQRNVLRTKIRVWEQLLPIYMPGSLQYINDHAVDSQPSPEAATATKPSEDPKASPDAAPATKSSKNPQPVPDAPAATKSSTNQSHQPEDLCVYLPSRIAPSERARVCRDGLLQIEERLRVGQCNDSLEGLRQVLRLKTRMIQFKNKNIRGQRDGTRSRAVIDRVHDRARAAAAKYRAARDALYRLRGAGDWEKTFRVLEDKDIRGYRDPDRLQPKKARKGVLEDDQVAPSPDVENDVEFTLFNETRKRRDGTGETRRTLSWIWMTDQTLPVSENTDELLRVEWAKSRARAARAREEVMLLQEEMRRVLKYLEWRAMWWRQRASLRQGLTAELAEGIQAYAKCQADIQDTLATHFKKLWEAPLPTHEGQSVQSTSADDSSDEDDTDVPPGDNIDEHEDEH